MYQTTPPLTAAANSQVVSWLNRPPQPGAASTVPAAAREQLLSFLSLSAHFTPEDIADLRELLTHFPPQAVYQAVQQACQEHLQRQAYGQSRQVTEQQLNKVLLAPLLHLHMSQSTRRPTAAVAA
ncbi:hypothetical protein [Hymenobacter sp. B81]|uniref:hypothetical protein n=1 Tax=Hymenobacter sp. B81 TaxID=3344878 RepID=UPI0037DCE409